MIPLNPEFISYQEIKHDSRKLGIAEIRVFGRLLMRYKHLKSKAGHDFFTPESSSINRDVEQVYLPAFELENATENKELSLFVREHVYKILKQAQDYEAVKPLNF